MTKWDEIYRSLRRERNEKLSYQLYQVNINNLTSYLDELYDKIAKLEARLDKQDDYQQEQQEQ
jgi:hypothetical protein